MFQILQGLFSSDLHIQLWARRLKIRKIGSNEIFDDFDWDSEVRKLNEFKKCSPTLTVLTNGQDEMVWVSGYGDAGSVQFVSACYFPGEVSKWFGWSKAHGTVNLHTEYFSKAQARKAVELFVAKRYDKLRELYA